ncbi:MAG: thiamine diphosphokinase [Bacteroidales bacterium]|nr:thiamine diphosphokinase [Candidatus Cryptobacteroides choladohippi]MCQ2179297.1 thiamine diphosphokinase [Bacteroidales bacterium]
MKNIVVLAAGDYPRKEYPKWLLDNADVLVACDSAIAALLRRGKDADVVVGDFDSATRKCLGKTKARVVRNPDQECNDLTKAILHVLESYPDVTDIHILGGTGKSEAHTVGNLSLLMQYEKDYGLSDRGIRLEMVSDYSTSFAITGSTELHVGEGRRISIFSPDNTLRISSRGLRWPLDGVVFDNWWKASLNIASEDVVQLDFNHPSMALVILD